jgi:hypothetical protein
VDLASGAPDGGLHFCDRVDRKLVVLAHDIGQFSRAMCSTASTPGPGSLAAARSFTGHPPQWCLQKCVITTATNGEALVCSIERRHGSSIFRLPSTGPLAGVSNREVQTVTEDNLWPQSAA